MGLWSAGEANFGCEILPSFRCRCRTRRGEAAKQVFGRPSPFWDGGSHPVDFDSELGSVRETEIKAFWWCLPLESLLRQKEMKRVRVDRALLCYTCARMRDLLQLLD